MKKIMCMLLLMQGGFMIAQTKTVVSPYGEKIQINPYVNNGLEANNGYVQLGGALTKPSVLNTTSDFTLAIEGLVAGSATDNILVVDSNNILRKVSASSLTATDWNLLGNAGTNSSVNFLGTTDNQPLQFKINNTNAGKVSTATTSFGYNALNPVSTGTANTAFGTSTLAANNDGSFNTAMGYLALSGNTSGSGNVAFGYNSGSNITTGGNNIIIGSGTTANVSSPTASNEMNIGNTLFGTAVNNTIGTGKIGINTNAPTAAMDVNGYARVRTMDTGTVTDNVVTVDSNGNLRKISQIDASAVTLGFAKLGAGADLVPYGAYIYTGTTITLPPGKWLVSINMLATKSSGTLAATGSNESWWIRSGFSDTSTSYVSSTDIISTNSLLSGLLPPSSYYAMTMGTVIINNTTGANKTYYYWAGNAWCVNGAGTVLKYGGSNWGEDYITFQKIN